MEHRWGKRIAVDIGVRISAWPSTIGVGRIVDVSMSGAWIRAHLNLSVLSRVMIILDSSPAGKQQPSSIGAYVTRTSREGFGVEWYELDPPSLSKLLHPAAFPGNAGSEVAEYPNTPAQGIALLMADLSSLPDLFEPAPSSLRSDSE
jgi:hypothetical protein